MSERDKPYCTVTFAGITIEHYPGHNPYEPGTFHYQMHEKMDETLWNALRSLPSA